MEASMNNRLENQVRYEVLTQAMGPRQRKDGTYNPNDPRIIKATTRIVMEYAKMHEPTGRVTIEQYRGDLPEESLPVDVNVDPRELEGLLCSPGLDSIAAAQNGRPARVLLNRRFPHVRGFSTEFEGVNAFRTTYNHKDNGNTWTEGYELVSTNTGVNLIGAVKDRRYKAEWSTQAAIELGAWLGYLGEKPRRFTHKGVELTAVKREADPRTKKGTIYIAVRFNKEQPRFKFD